MTGQRGILYLDITVRGRAAHTTALRIGVNAIDRAARIVAALGEMTPHDASRRPRRSRGDGQRGDDRRGPGPQHRPRAVPADRRHPLPAEQTAADVLRDVRHAVASANADEADFPTKIEPEVTCIRNPRSSLRLPDDHPLVGWTAEMHLAATGRPARLGFHPAWPDTPILNEAGIPAVTYGPGSMECYWDDESVLVDDYLAAVRTYCVAAASTGCPRPRTRSSSEGRVSGRPADGSRRRRRVSARAPCAPGAAVCATT